MTGIMVAAAGGAAYTAELGTMTVNGRSGSHRSHGHRPSALVGEPASAGGFHPHAMSVRSFQLLAMAGASMVSWWQFDISHRLLLHVPCASLLQNPRHRGGGASKAPYSGSSLAWQHGATRGLICARAALPEWALPPPPAWSPSHHHRHRLRYARRTSSSWLSMTDAPKAGHRAPTIAAGASRGHDRGPHCQDVACSPRFCDQQEILKGVNPSSPR